MKDLLSWDETLFKNPEVFESDYIPEYFAHRDVQMQSLLFNIRPALHNAKPLNVLCRGPPGTGKTTAVRKIFEHIHEHTQRIRTSYVNCQVSSTRYMVASQMFKDVFGYAPPATGTSFKKLYTRTLEYLHGENKALIVALDDMNYLFHSGEVDNTLYPLLRASEIEEGVRVGVIGIMSDTGVPYTFDAKIQSVFQPEEILFPPYTFDEVCDILRHRVRIGFYPDVVDSAVLEHICRLTMKHGDLRVGIDLLKRSALMAEMKARRKIAIEDVESAYAKSRLFHLEHLINTLKPDELTLLRIIAENNNVRAGELYKSYRAATGFGYTTFYETLSFLESLKLVQPRYTGKGMRGRSRIISVTYPAEELLQRIRS
jgi:cell division control protein 6